ncbi:anti-sigma F factor antagonist [Acrocarpospora phusangensis]|uniref:Anti-sigma factor antagonist n=2 Tax=Acrocarpospora phusangensis TaxID=1070424 RepID=A0A919QIE2_9ACTN|nr:anti-sigma F factor antagonist [Acrocarpospora phusangensis]
MQMPGLQVLTDRHDPYVVITVLGDVDTTTIAQLQEHVEHARRISPHLLFDLAGMTFMDSAGIRVLLDAYNHARANQGTVAVCSPRPSPRKVMELVGLTGYIPVHDSLTEALTS